MDVYSGTSEQRTLWGQYKFSRFVFYGEVFLSLEVLNVCNLWGMAVIGTSSSVVNREVKHTVSVPFSVGPLLEILLYIYV